MKLRVPVKRIPALETHSVRSSSSVTGEDCSSRVVLNAGRQVLHSKSQILIGDLCWVGLLSTKAEITPVPDFRVRPNESNSPRFAGTIERHFRQK